MRNQILHLLTGKIIGKNERKEREVQTLTTVGANVDN